MPNFSGLWTVRQQLQAIGASLWPSKPGAPTIGTATQASTTSVTVTFTAPTSDGNLPITGYRVTASSGGITATGSSSPITVTGLTTGNTYTFTVAAQNSAGYSAESSASNSVTLSAQTYTNRVQFSYTGADQSWTVPANVTNLRVLAWGAGGTGGGNSAGATNAGGTGLGGNAIDCGIAVTAGESLTFAVGQSVSFNGGNGGCLAQSAGYGVGGTTSGAGGTGDGGGTNGNSGGSGGGSSGVLRSGTVLCAAGGGGGGGGASPQGVGQAASVTTGGTGGTKTGNGTNGGSGSNYSGGGGGGASGSTQGQSGANAGTGGGNFVPSLPANYPYAQNTYTASGTTPGNSSNSDRSGAGVGGSAQTGGVNGFIVIYY